MRLKERVKNGIHIRTYNMGLLILTAFVCISLLTNILQLQKQFDIFLDSENNYQLSASQAVQLKASSDNLTNQVQHFATTGELRYLNGYFDEITSGRRDQIIDVLEQLYPSKDNYELISLARTESDELMLFEYHAMKLVTSALQMEDTSIPSEIADYPLSSEEEAASSTAKMQTAVEIVFGDSYQAKKDTIDSYIEQFTDSILEQLLNENQINSQKTKTLLIRELISVIFMILISIAIYWIWYTQVIVILEKYIKCIVLNRPLEQHGAYEFRYLAESYNFVSQKINEENIKLHHSAEHDALTGLINRSTLEYNIKKALSGLTPAPSYGAFLLVDVDGFKSINDSYGHGCGDRMLQTVAHLLKSTFRTTDLVARFGGDEFAVWLYGIKEEHTFVIVNYIQKINDALQHPANDLPKESLSVGAIFVKKDEDFNSFYKKADLALYQVKEHGKCNILFYDQSMGE